MSNTTRRPIVLHVYKDYYPPVVGGVEMTINLMAHGCIDNYEPWVLVSGRHKHFSDELIDGVRVISVPEWGRMASAPVSPAFVTTLRRLSQGADLLHFHHPNPTGDLAHFLTRSRLPAVMTYHSDVVRQKYAMVVYGHLQKWMMSRMNAIMPTSPNYIDSSPWLQRFRDKCKVVPLGISMDRFEPEAYSPARVEQIRAAYREPIILFVGRLRYYKGLKYLLDAMPAVLNGCLVIGGTGNEEENLKAHVSRLHLENRVHFAGDLSESDVVAHMYAARVFCMPSHLRSEAFGLSQVEAMACGLPVVSTTVRSGVPFVNKEGVSGLSVPPENPAALAAALNRLLSDEILRRRLGAGAWDRAHQMFSAASMCDNLQRVYAGVFP